jgi:hypothetical protein
VVKKLISCCTIVAELLAKILASGIDVCHVGSIDHLLQGLWRQAEKRGACDRADVWCACEVNFISGNKLVQEVEEKEG